MRSVARRLQKYLGRPCPWCGETMLAGPDRMRGPTRDHVRPRYRSPHGSPGIFVVVCARCNEAKKHYTVEEWLRRLRKGNDPRAPRVAAWLEAFGPIPAPLPTGARATLADVWPAAEQPKCIKERAA